MALIWFVNVDDQPANVIMLVIRVGFEASLQPSNVSQLLAFVVYQLYLE